MRFLPSTSRRTVAEALLAVAIIAFVVYDLSDRSAKPASSDVVISYEAKGKAGLSTPASRFGTTYSSSITGSNLIGICGTTAVPAPTTLSVGNSSTAQALVVQLSNGCPIQAAVVYINPATNASSYPAVSVAANSFLSLQNVIADGLQNGVTMGTLTMAAGSTLEVFLGNVVSSSEYSVTNVGLITSAGACPTINGVVTTTVTGCPSDPAVSLTGAWSCSLFAAAVGSNCNIFLSMNGALSQSSVSITIVFAKDCNSYTPAMFKAAITAATGIPAKAINIVSWNCASVSVTFTILGNNAAGITAAVTALVTSAVTPNGALFTGLAVLSVSVNGTCIIGCISLLPIGGANYYAVPYCNYYTCPTTLPFNPSQSNPGLLALLTLLVIPVAIFVGVLIWCCLPRAPVCEPMPVCPPAPACPPVYYAEPYAMPCPDTCIQEAAPVYCTPSPTPAMTSPTF